tara:strand:+ start:7944 stop:10091 length:2148 start_codon:yes stop_codon:yes gene_type:complete
MAEELYLTWGDDSEREKAYASSSDNIEAYDGVQKAVAWRSRTFLDIQPNRSVRPSFTRDDYNAFRFSETAPNKQKRIIKMCMDAYDKVGIIRNVIDLMADFSSQGITIVHPNKTIERFYRKWFNEIGGTDRSERFLNYLYRTGNVITRRRTAKISTKKEKELRRAAAADMVIENVKITKREIPWQYDFLNPLAVDVRNSDVGLFTGKYDLVLNLSNTTYQNLTKNKQNLAVLPEDIRRRLEKGDKFVKLDPKNVNLFHYKKDDWLLWANPMIYAILDDIMMLEKMKLADMAALDGAISNIRLWTLGDLEHKILPKKAVITKLRDILASNVGGGTMDLVWGPELDFKESNSQVYKFLGSEKYQPVLTSIYAGLGIPPTLTGAATGGGYSNNYVSLKTLIERLEYGRDTLRRFWEGEIRIIQKAMGFRLPAQIHFDSIILSDEAAQKQLLVQLADRDIISHETLLERFRELPSIEKIRVRREEKQRATDVLSPDKAGPYHNPQHKEDVAKIALTKDLMDSETYLNNLGLPPGAVEETEQEGPDKIPPRENKTRIDERDETKQLQGRPHPEDPDGGRPRFSRDKKKRKQKRVLPRSRSTDKVSGALWATCAQKTISELMTPVALDHFGKKNVRSLNKAEFDQLEHLKLCILTGLKPYMEIDELVIKQILDNNTKPSEAFLNYVEGITNSFIENNSRKPNVEELRQIYAMSFVEMSSFG